MDASVMDDGGAFTNFLRDVDPRKAELERFGWPTDGERPGSKEDQRMRVEHETRKVDLARTSEDRAAAVRRLRLVEAAQEYSLRNRGTTEQEHDIAAYSQRKRNQRKAS